MFGKRRSMILVATTLLVLAQLSLAAEYWVGPDGNDRSDGSSRQQAWASPSRGQPTRLSKPYKAAQAILPVRSTEGFLDSGSIRMGQETRAYTSKTADSFVLVQGFAKDFPDNELVYDAAILGGKSFRPGDIINLAGGTYLNRPLHFTQSGAQGRPIIYRSAPGEKVVLVSDVHNKGPVRRIGTPRTGHTRYVTLKGLTIQNTTDGNHAAPGISLSGVDHIVVDSCDVDISGRDVNGDGDAVKIGYATNLLITRCRLRSREANGVSVRRASNVRIVDSVIYESFNGISAVGASVPGHVTVKNCTIYATNRYGAASAETPGTVTVINCIVAQMPSASTPALRGTGRGDYNCLWHVANDYGKGWNGLATGRPGAHDITTDPMFVSLNPANPNFLRIAENSPAATAGQNGGHIGAFAPIPDPKPAVKKVFNVREFGALGNGTHDDLPAIKAAIAAAAKNGSGKIVFPRTGKSYLVSDAIKISSDHIDLFGPGVTIKLKPGAGRMDLIEIGSHQAGPGRGLVRPVVEYVTIEGFILDGSYRSQPQQRSGNNPRGLWVGNANKIVAKKLVIRDTFCGLTFGPGARNCDAIDVTVTDWDHDGYGASGRGKNGGCTDIRFIRCKAVKTAKCVKAWEIEEGAQRIYLEDCLVQGIPSTGFYVRHHAYRWPVLVDDVKFVRCKVRNTAGTQFLIVTAPGPAIRPTIRTRNIRLIDCEADGKVAIAAGAEDVHIVGGKFTGPMFLGIGMNKPAEERGPKWPVRSVVIENVTLASLEVNATTGNSTGVLGDKYYRDYESKIVLKNVTLLAPMKIEGKRSNVIIEDGN